MDDQGYHYPGGAIPPIRFPAPYSGWPLTTHATHYMPSNLGQATLYHDARHHSEQSAQALQNWPPYPPAQSCPIVSNLPKSHSGSALPLSSSFHAPSKAHQSPSDSALRHPVQQHEQPTTSATSEDCPYPLPIFTSAWTSMHSPTSTMVTRAEVAQTLGISSLLLRSARTSEPPEKVKPRSSGPLSLPPSEPSQGRRQLTNVRSFLSSDSSRASSPVPTPTVSTSIPHNVQEALRAWFYRYGFAQSPPCVLRNYGSALFGSDSTGAPVVYRFQSGIQYQVQPFRVTSASEVQNAGRRSDATLLVASHPTHISIIIGQPPGPAYDKSERFRIWAGITASDPDGWSAEEVYSGSSSRKKTLDLLMFRGPHSQLPRIDIRTMRVIPEGSQANSQESKQRFSGLTEQQDRSFSAQANDFSSQVASKTASQHDGPSDSPASRSLGVDPPTSSEISNDSNKPRSGAGRFLPTATKIPVAPTKADVAPIKALPSPLATKDNDFVEDERYFRKEVPDRLRRQVERWHAEHGADKPLACGTGTNNWKRTFHDLKGELYEFLHVNGDELDVRLWRVPSPVAQRNAVLVAEGPHTAACFIHYRRQFRTPYGAGSLYYQWPSSEVSSTGESIGEPEVLKAPPAEALKLLEVLRERLDEESALSVLSASPDQIEIQRPATPAITRAVATADRRSSLTELSSSAGPSPLPLAVVVTSVVDDERYFRKDIPDRLKHVIEQWVMERGYPLPCAMSAGHHGTTFRHQKNYLYRFVHVTGDILNVRFWRLPNSVKHFDHVLIAESTNIEPFIIHFKHQLRTRHGYGMLYHRWQGVRGATSLGYDEQACVVKGAPSEVHKVLEDLKARLEQGDDQEFQAHTTDEIQVQRPPTPAFTRGLATGISKSSLNESPSTTADDLNADTLPKKCQKLIDDWLRLHPKDNYSTLPVATASAVETITKGSNSGESICWKYKDGTPLTADMYRLPYFASWQNAPRRRVIIVQGKNLGPWMVAHKPGPNQAPLHGAAKIWVGFKGDRYGFESGISVFKEYAITGDKVQSRPRAIPSLTEDVKSRKHYDLSSAPPLAKRSRLESFGDRSSAMPSPSKVLTLKLTLTPKIALSRLRPHLSHNLVCLFYVPNKAPPRMRLFSACDTSQKLFAQAMAGELFEASSKVKSGSKILQIRIGKAKSTKLVVVEDDEDDFENMLEGVAQSGWFEETKSGVEGSGCIKIRAML